jgi:hypothetical protein
LSQDPPPDRTRFGELLLYVLGFVAAIALAAYLIVWLLRHL